MANFAHIRRLAAAAFFLASLSPAAPVQWTSAMGGNNNWYDYVPGNIFDPFSFGTARAAALASTHLGMSGYLATVTSLAEHQFIRGSFGFLAGFGNTGNQFLGASDADVEGVFRWLDGPEAGQTLSYTNWATGQPTGSGDGLAMLINYNFGGAEGWVDTNGAFGYVIEYGDGVANSAVPEPSTILLLAGGLAVWCVLKLRSSSESQDALRY